MYNQCHLYTNCIIATNRYPSPANIYLTDAQPGTLVFNWTPVITNCSTLQYSIISDCGTCPTITNATTAICSDFQLTTNANLCNFSVSSRACDLTGNPSSPIVVTLKGMVTAICLKLQMIIQPISSSKYSTI